MTAEQAQYFSELLSAGVAVIAFALGYLGGVHQ